MAKRMNDVETIEQMERDARALAEKLNIFCDVYRNVEQSAHIDAYVWKEDENGDRTYVAPDEDDWRYDRYVIWQKVLDAMMEVVKKL